MIPTALRLPASQPAVKLAHANMALLLRFTMSPEVLSQARVATGQLMQQAGTLGLKMMQTGAYAQLVQGMLRNYGEFLGDAARAGKSG